MNASDRRILAAFRCIDAITGSSVVRPLTVQPISSPLWVIKPNRSGAYVIFDGPQYHALTTQFVPTTKPWPAPDTFEVSIQDPTAQYLPRRAKLQAPLSIPTIVSSSASGQARSSAVNDPASVFCAQSVSVYPSAAATTAPNWSVVRVSVVRDATPASVLPWAVLQIARASDKAIIAKGMSGKNGEALLAVAGLKILPTGNGALQQRTEPVTITAWFDPATLKQPTNWVPNPDDIFDDIAKTNYSSNLKSATAAAQLGVVPETIASLAIAF